MKMLFCFMGWWWLGVALMAEVAPNRAVEDPNAWSIRTYRLLAEEMNAPALPVPNAEEKDFELFLRSSHERVSQFLVKECGLTLPEGSLAAYDMENRTLVVRTVNSVQGLVGTFAQQRRLLIPMHLSFTVHVVEGDAASLRMILAEASRHGDHSDLWQRVQTFVEVGKAREVETLRLETRSGQRALLARTRPSTHSLYFTVDPNNRVAVEQKKREIGTTFEVDPVLGADGRTVDLNYCLDHHYGPPTNRWPVILQDTNRRLEGQVTDYHSAKVTTATATLDGMTRLIGAWTPEGVAEPERAGHLQLAFLSTDVVPLLPAEDGRLAQLLKMHGEKIVRTPPPAEVNVAPMIMRAFKVPPDFIGVPLVNGPGAAVDRGDPFRQNANAIPEKPTPMDILKAAGVSFPPGASAKYDRKTSTLIVINTLENLDTIESFVDDLHKKPPVSLACTLHIVQMEAKPLRDLMAQSRQLADHTAMWRALEEAEKQGHAKIVSTLWYETRSGQRALIEAGTEFMFPEMSHFEFAEDALAAKSKKPATAPPKAPVAPAGVVAPPETATTANIMVGITLQRVGFQCQIDPVIGPDGLAIDAGLDLHWHFAPPTVRSDLPAGGDKVMRVGAPAVEFHQANIDTNTELTSGMTRLLGVWKPEGTPEFEKEDVLQAAFLKMDVVPVK